MDNYLIAGFLDGLEKRAVVISSAAIGTALGTAGRFLASQIGKLTARKAATAAVGKTVGNVAARTVGTRAITSGVSNVARRGPAKTIGRTLMHTAPWMPIPNTPRQPKMPGTYTL